jgi:hypothetical protein
VAQKLKLDEFDQTTALNQGVASLIDANFEQAKQRIALERERNVLDEKLRKVHTFHERDTRKRLCIGESVSTK